MSVLSKASRSAAHDNPNGCGRQFSFSGIIVLPVLRRSWRNPFFRQKKTAPTQAQPFCRLFARASAVKSSANRSGGLFRFDGIYEVLLGPHPVFERQRMIRQLVAEHFVGVLPHLRPAQAGGEWLRLFAVLYGCLFHISPFWGKDSPVSCPCNRPLTTVHRPRTRCGTALHHWQQSPGCLHVLP
jgi:hypothetical protein